MTAIAFAAPSPDAASHSAFPAAPAARNLSPATPNSTSSGTSSNGMFGRLKDWRRIATRYDRCAHTFFSAICIATTVIFWL